MATLNELDTAPDCVADRDAQIDGPPFDLAYHDESAAENDAGGESECIADVEQQSDLLLPDAPRRDSKIRQVVRMLLKPLFVVATAQYTLVTVLAGLTAYAVATNASKLVNASLEPVIAALKRL